MFKNAQHEKNVAFAVAIGNLRQPPPPSTTPPPMPPRQPLGYKLPSGEFVPTGEPAKK